MKTKVSIIPVQSNYQESDWSGFLRCWRGRYAEIHGSNNGSIISKHEVSGGNAFDSNKLQQKLNLSLPKSYLDFLASYCPIPDWTRSDLMDFNSFMLPATMVDFLPNSYPEFFKIWTRECQEASDADYYVYGPEQDDAVFRSFQYEYLIIVGKTSENDFIALNPCVRTIDGEMEVILHSSAAIHRTLSFASMMKNMYYYECESPESYPPYSEEMLNKGCASLISAGDPISRLY